MPVTVRLDGRATAIGIKDASNVDQDTSPSLLAEHSIELFTYLPRANAIYTFRHRDRDIKGCCSNLHICIRCEREGR